MRRFICLLAMILTLGSFATVSAGQGDSPEAASKNWSIDLRVKNFFNSHTSYEFGNPYPPGQSPLSRLEFPLNTWWAGLEVRRSFSRFSIGLEALRNLSVETDGVFKDSDWTDDEHPNVRTIYSESKCRMDPSYSLRADLDMKVSDWLRLPDGFDLRPVLGIRWQRLAFVSHDGTQYSSENNTYTVLNLPGDGIRFEQTYWQYFIGLRGIHDLSKALKLSRVTLHWQVDWAYVEGNNQDHHLLRAGKRITEESTSGDAWHAGVGFKIGLTKSINAGVDLDYLRIKTTGSHRLVNSKDSIDFSFNNGVTVWSEQMSIMLRLEYIF